MASCSSSLALYLWHPLSFRAPSGGRLHHRCQAVAFRDSPGLKWAAARACSRRVVVMASASGSENSTHSSGGGGGGGGGAPAVQPRRKRGRPKKAEGVGATEGEEEEEWDFFGELESHIENESRRGWPGVGAKHGEATDAEVVAPTTSNAGIVVESGEIDGSVPGAGTPLLGEEDTSGDEDEEIDYDDPKYEQKPDWMQDAVWQAIKNQAPGDEDDEGQPLWVDEDDPTWPEEEGPEDGWGFRTSQFFDKVSIKNEVSAEDDDDDDEALKMNWDSEADDWMIKEITATEWEYNVFADPSPLIVYAFARYGRRGMDSWKMLEQLEKAVTSVWESAKAPLRAVKVDIGMEIDLGSALGISKDECPQLLFIKNGKGLYRLKDQRTSEELVQLLAHFFYHGKRPSFLKTTSSPESMKSVA